MNASYCGPVRVEFLALVGHPHRYLAEHRWNQLGGTGRAKNPNSVSDELDEHNMDGS